MERKIENDVFRYGTGRGRRKAEAQEGRYRDDDDDDDDDGVAFSRTIVSQPPCHFSLNPPFLFSPFV